MTYPNRPRSHARNGHRWRTVSGAAKRKWLRQGAVRCALCAHWVDINAAPLTDWSLSVDHVVPVTINPALEYRSENLQPACLACNRVRQDRDLATITRDPDLFRREVELAVAKRELTAEKKAAALTAPVAATTRFQDTPWSRDWLPGMSETDEARQRRHDEWKRIPPEWM